jgi:DNA adenine methylase
MGSKQKLIPFLQGVLSTLEFDTSLDAMSGSGAVAYLLKQMGKQVVANDHLEFCYHFAKAAVENQDVLLEDDDVDRLCAPNPRADDFISQTFDGLYFGPIENQFLDSFSRNVSELRNPWKQSLALAAIARSCMKARPRGVFTYTGYRYDDARRDLRLSLEEHFREAASCWNRAVFGNGRDNKALNVDAFALADRDFDLVYLDPPYVSPHSDNEYTRRYHFVEGLMSYWQRVEIQHHTQTKKIRKRNTPFGSKRTVVNAFEAFLDMFPRSIMVISYSSNGIPSKDELTELLKSRRRTVEVHAEKHSYTFGTHGHKLGNGNNRVDEYLFVGKPR